MKKRYYVLAAVAVAIVAFGFAIATLGTRSGVSAAQVAERLSGDDIFPKPWASIDRAAVLPVSSEVAWPWVVQLGSQRAGWYAPLWIEKALNKYAASTTLPQYQTLHVGQQIPDFGGGALRVIAIVPGQYVTYCSIASIDSTDPTCHFTWTLVLENNTASSTIFHIRLRIPEPTTYTWLPPAVPGFIDYITDIVMFAGLKEQLHK